MPIRFDVARASLIVIGLAWLLPFVQPWHHPPIPSFYSEWLAFALGLLALLPLLQRAHWQPWALPRVIGVPVALTGLLLLQLALGRIAYPQQGLLAVMYLVYFSLLCWLGHTLRATLDVARVVRVLAWSLLAGGAISASLALVQHVGGQASFGGWINAAGGATQPANLGQVNHAADYLALALAALGYLGGTRRLPAALAVVLGGLLLVALAYSGSRSSWLYLSGFVGVTWAARGQIGQRPWRIALLLLPAFGLVQGLAHLSWFAGPVAVTTPTDRLFNSAGGIDARLALWQEAWRIWLDAPLLGAGFGQFAYALFMGEAPGSVLAGSLFNHAHNLPMQFLAEFGVFGFVIVVGGIGAWLVRSLRQRWSAEQTWLHAVLSVLLIHSLLEYPLWYAFFLGIAAFLIGMGETHTMRLRVSGVARAGFGAALVLAAVSLVRLGIDYTALDRAVALSREPTALPLVQATLERTQQESLLAPYIEYVYGFGITLDREQVQEKLAFNTQVMHFAPTRDTVYRQVLLLALADQSAAARAMLKQAMAVYPDDIAAFVQSARELEGREAATIGPLRMLAENDLLNRKQQGVEQ